MTAETKPYKALIKSKVSVPDVSRACELAARQGADQDMYWHGLHKKSVRRDLYHPHVNGFTKPGGPSRS